MAKKYKSSFKSAVDSYQSKNRDRKRRGANIGSFLGAGASKKRRKKSSRKKKTYSKSTTKAKSTGNETTSEPFTAEDWKYLLIFVAFIAIAVATSFAFAIIIAVIVLVIKVIIEMKNSRESNTISATGTLSQTEIDELRRHLTNIDVYKDVANNSSDPYAVQCAMDELLRSIDFIMGYDEEDLHLAGMSKEKLPAQRTFIIKHYDDMIAQAREKNNEITEASKNDSTSDMQNNSTELSPLSNCESPQKENESETPVSQEVPSLESRLKIAVPSNQGLFPHEILMLNYAHTYKTSDNKFQGFWYYQYSVTDPQSILSSLHERGFIVVGNIRSTLEQLKVTELKEALQASGAKSTGKKAELIDRLMDVGNLQTLEEKYPNRYFALTEKSQREINDNEYVMYLHRTKYMSIWDMNYLLYNDNLSHLGYRDILWREFNVQSDKHFKAGDFGLYRNTRLDMYQFLMEENKYKAAFNMLCEVVAYDLSGLGNSERLDTNPTFNRFILEQTIKNGFPYSNSLFTIPPAVIAWMSELKELLKLSDVNFRAMLLENFEKISLYRRIFTNEECVDVVMNEIGNHPRKQAALYKQVEERLKAKLDNMKM